MFLVGATMLAIMPLLGMAQRAMTETYDATVVADGATHYYPLNPRHGGHDLVGSQNCSTHGNVSFTARGAQLDGEDDYLDCGDHDDFSVRGSGSKTAFSVEAWIRLDSLDDLSAGEYIHWLGKGTTDSYEWGCRLYDKTSPRPNRLSCYQWNTGGGEGAGSYWEAGRQDGGQPALTTSRWVHLVSTVDMTGVDPGPAAGSEERQHADAFPGKISLYKDGAFIDSDYLWGFISSAGTTYYDIDPTNTAASLKLGTRNGPEEMPGRIRRVALYDKLLTAAQIAEHNSEGRPPG
jgi:hypothetical protein